MSPKPDLRFRPWLLNRSERKRLVHIRKVCEGSVTIGELQNCEAEGAEQKVWPSPCLSLKKGPICYLLKIRRFDDLCENSKGRCTFPLVVQASDVFLYRYAKEENRSVSVSKSWNDAYQSQVSDMPPPDYGQVLDSLKRIRDWETDDAPKRWESRIVYESLKMIARHVNEFVKCKTCGNSPDGLDCRLRKEDEIKYKSRYKVPGCKLYTPAVFDTRGMPIPKAYNLYDPLVNRIEELLYQRYGDHREGRRSAMYRRQYLHFKWLVGRSEVAVNDPKSRQHRRDTEQLGEYIERSFETDEVLIGLLSQISDLEKNSPYTEDRKLEEEDRE